MAEASKNEAGQREHKPWIDVRVDATDKGKAKRGEGFVDLLALLDEDDAYELRQRIKNRLMEQIDRGEIDGAISFEELLNSRERPKRK